MDFSGRTNLVLDDRGRIGMPARYRDELRVGEESKVWVTTGLEPSEKCVLIYPERKWRKVKRALKRQDTSQAHVRWAQRVLAGQAERVLLDSNGRVLIPQNMRDHAGLHKKVVLVGVLDKFELWAEPLYEEVMKKGQEYAGMDLGIRY